MPDRAEPNMILTNLSLLLVTLLFSVADMQPQSFEGPFLRRPTSSLYNSTSFRLPPVNRPLQRPPFGSSIPMMPMQFYRNKDIAIPRQAIPVNNLLGRLLFNGIFPKTTTTTITQPSPQSTTRAPPNVVPSQFILPPLNISAILTNNGTLPVGVVNETLYVNVTNVPLPTKVEQPIETTSDQLAGLLDGIGYLLLNFLGLAQSVASRGTCPTDSDFGTVYNSPCRRFGGSCYCFFYTLKYDWDTAQSFCKDAGFDGLVTLEKSSKAKGVATLASLLAIPSKSFWTSGSKLGGIFLWSNTGQFFSAYPDYWISGQPDDQGSTPGAECVVTDLGNEGKWADEVCSDEFNFICESTSIANFIKSPP